MDFEGDAFISYAHYDNIGLSEGRRGWVANLQRALQIRVAQLLGKEPHIWWDPKLRGNDLLAETLVAQLQHVCALISVVSPRYVRSEWSLRELAEFCRAAAEQGGLHVCDKSRVFKVLKRPVPLDQQPAELQALLGYEFFKVDPDSGRVRELDEIFGPEAERDFWIKLDDLAHDVCALVESLQSPAIGSEPAMVYLAETTSDLRAERDLVRRGLQQQGYVVLPARTLPLSETELAASIREDLARCRMSIHMFGRTYGVVPEGGAVSVLETQNELAIERASQAPLSRLVWIPRGLSVDDDRQQAVIDGLRADQRVPWDADLLETSLEDLQTAIVDGLSRGTAASRSDAAPGRDAAATQVYLIYDRSDLEAVAPWADCLFEHFEVVHPCFEGDEAEIRGFHEDNLRSCDGVLILHGSASSIWLRRKLAELQRSAGYGRAKDAAAAVCLLPPERPDKLQFRTHLATVIPQMTGFSSEALEPFVAAVKGRQDEERSGRA